MLNGRIYRAALAPVLLAVVIAGFSLGERSSTLSANLAPDAFDGARAFAEMQSLAAQFPDRRPGGLGDGALARYIAASIRALGTTAGGGFSVTSRELQAQTIEGSRTLTTVIAERPGASGESPIVILAPRDAPRAYARARAASFFSSASPTVVLLELARVFAASETQRAIVLVSTSGASGGAAGASDFTAHAPGSVDAAIVLGDFAGPIAHGPIVVPFSSGLGGAPALLQGTLVEAIRGQAGIDPGAPGALSRLAHLALGLTAGEQGPLNAAGIPAVLVQVGGERGPTAGEPASAARLEGLGRAVLSAVYALDAGPDVREGETTGLLLQGKVIPAWALRLLVAALLLGPLLTVLDGLARLRRGRLEIRPAATWALACALPFLLLALFARVLGLFEVIPTPAGLSPGGAMPFGAPMIETALALTLVLALSWIAWPGLLRRAGVPRRPNADAAGLSILLVLLALAFVVWVFNPFAAILLVPAAHLWLPVVSGGRLHSSGVRGRALALALTVLAAAPLAGAIAVYAGELALGPADVVRSALVLLAAGHFGVLGTLLWCLALGCFAGMAILALRTAPPPPLGAEPLEDLPITIRGPLSYAGPGSLGGTTSALRR
ncbi:MAG TPA: hypothetical protein VGX16_00430 [Solirubrobacteraceae bacterium]|nr:hypothetical protein [Solirubrobacteraceae bacterium]